MSWGLVPLVSAVGVGGTNPEEMKFETLYNEESAEPDGNDQVGGTREQLAHRREVLRSSTISPNDPEHDDAEGWCKTVMNYTKGRIAELISDSD
uniref:Uncharacterized protein n=1 Tax=Solanum tuberosum TaxID=4113 RepID=M1DXW9_SOLTU